MAKVLDGERKRAYGLGKPGAAVEDHEALVRMAEVLLSPLRSKIVTALSVRTMSPKMLWEELDNPRYELNTIDANLKELLRTGWVELVDIKTGGARRSATEHFYRATQLPVFDSVTWPMLPLAMREMASWRIFEVLTGRVTNALAAGTMDARDDRHFTWTPGLVDQLGWDRIIERVDALFFDFVLEEVKGARIRLAESGEQGIPVTVALLAFESPAGRFALDRRRDPLAGSAASAAPASSKHAFPVRMAKAMVNELRLLILSELSTRPMSAKMFYEEFGNEDITEKRVYRAFETLRQFDWLVLVDTKTGGRRRSAKERLYRTARPPILDDVAWPALPDSLKDLVSSSIFETLADRLREAMKAGTMDARDDRHFTWTPGLVDQLGWDRIIERVDALFKWFQEERRSAEVRLDESEEQPIPVTVALAAFESPPPEIDHGAPLD